MIFPISSRFKLKLHVLKALPMKSTYDLLRNCKNCCSFHNVFCLTGVILPGETMKFPFVFKSPNAGVFTEQWKFETRPVLCGGASLIVTLRGIALQEDKFQKEREQLEVFEKKIKNTVKNNVCY